MWRECYPNVPEGAVFETNPEKATILSVQRPGWAVYEAKVEPALAAGAGDHLMVNVLDVDPYGDPWPTIQAFFESERPRPERLDVVVNDGLRSKIQRGGRTKTTQEFEGEYGGHLYACYLEVCRRLMQQKAQLGGYTLSRWAGYHCGTMGAMTHYWAVLTREARA